MVRRELDSLQEYMGPESFVTDVNVHGQLSLAGRAKGRGLVPFDDT